MAGRPKKLTVNYFPHYTNAADGRTLTVLQSKFGNDGYAAWFKILERLGASDGHYYSCQLSVDWNYLVAKLGTTPISATEILNTLADLDAIDKELWGKKVIWCQKFVNGLSEVYRKRDAEIPSKPIIDDGNITTTPISATEIQEYNPISATENTQREEGSIEREEGNRGNIFSCYEKNIGQITPFIADSIQDALKEFPEEWIPEAIKIAVERNTRKWAYVEGILKSWQVNGKNNGHSKDKKQPFTRQYRDLTNERLEHERARKNSSAES
jgi:DnaD/phage-associated family protein